MLIPCYAPQIVCLKCIINFKMGYWPKEEVQIHSVKNNTNMLILRYKIMLGLHFKKQENDSFHYQKIILPKWIISPLHSPSKYKYKLTTRSGIRSITWTKFHKSKMYLSSHVPNIFVRKQSTYGHKSGCLAFIQGWN